MYRGVARCAGVAVTSGTLGEGKDTRPGSHEERPLWSRNKKELSDQPTGQREPWSPSASKGSTVSWGVAEQCVRNQEKGVPFERLHGGLSLERQESCSLGPAKPGEGCFSPSGQNCCSCDSTLHVGRAAQPGYPRTGLHPHFTGEDLKRVL